MRDYWKLIFCWRGLTIVNPNTARVILLNTGIALLVAGGASGVPTLTVVGAAGCLTAVIVALAVLAEAAFLTGRAPQAIPVARSGGG